MERDENEWLVEGFEANRSHLHAVAYRMLGSADEAEDAVQEAWLRLNRATSEGAEDAEEIRNLRAWLTTVVARISLDMLRARKARRQEELDDLILDTQSGAQSTLSRNTMGEDPEAEAVMADSVGIALLVVLESLSPSERLAFVLHDLFAVPFEEIAPIVGRTPTAARQLASRARRRVQGTQEEGEPATADNARSAAKAEVGESNAGKRAGVEGESKISLHQQIVNAFLTAARGGDFEGLLRLLDPDVVLSGDAYAAHNGIAWELRGAEAVAKRSANGGAQAAHAAIINDEVGVVVEPGGNLVMILRIRFNGEKISAIEGIANPSILAAAEIVPLGD